MTTKEREDLKKKASSLGLKSSAYDRNVQFDDKNRVKHIDDNRTRIKGKLYYGSHDANEALDNLGR